MKKLMETVVTEAMNILTKKEGSRINTPTSRIVADVMNSLLNKGYSSDMANSGAAAGQNQGMAGACPGGGQGRGSGGSGGQGRGRCGGQGGGGKGRGGGGGGR